MDKQEKLKTQIRNLLLAAMKVKGKRPRDIVNETDHSKEYISKILNSDCNLSLDTTENLFKALEFKLHITLKPIYKN